ncbi:SAM-dependent methyltransferase [Sulfitobacter noctilucicola]|uniref:SAM-dependent methyltransferase n=1 Tax=Sulfitobacter noctilucicola TaxID=1342301 RepID=A0A7W6MBB8_9RHOB|nr:class I SAM-dependent methyltransferase [Sulfitobacter noctilucicola]KIN63385.1 SAM-dependent methyltransferase [Sulfitobacter noctilucicola]MBB4175097.1 SAM-dependent methyltransferase [Sulfitobacter noctilucicola]
MSHLDALKRDIDPSGFDVLDVGAGQGAFVRALACEGARATGIEVDEEAVARAKEVSGCDICLGTAQSLPFEPARFDLLTYIFSFHHIPEEFHNAAFAEAARVLRPDGRVFVAEPEIDGDMTRIVAAIDDETAVRTAALNSLSTLPQQHGLRRTDLAGYTLTRHYPSFDVLFAHLIAVDPARREKAALPENRNRMQDEFERRCRRTENGFELDQPVRCMMFDKTAALIGS